MSQMTATARPLRPLRAPRRGPAPTSLQVLPTTSARTGNGAFAAVCIALLTAGLITLLLLNTALAQGSLALGELQRESVRLSDTAGNLQEEVDRASATGALARSAAGIGMVRMGTRGYIDLSTGTVSGKPEPATRENAFSIVTSPTPPKVTAEVKKVLSSATAASAAVSAKPPQVATPTTPDDAINPTPEATVGAPSATPTAGTGSGSGGQARPTTVR